jgi:hypothetical protein
MVGSRHPTGIKTFLPCAAYQYILDRIVEAVPHMQHTGYIGWGNNHGISRAVVGFAAEILLLKPMAVPNGFGFPVVEIF